MVDLDYSEDSIAQVDANFVFSENSGISEIQISGENFTFNRKSMDEMLDQSFESVKKIFDLQKKIIGDL